MKDNECLSGIKPLKTYSTPKYPDYSQAGDNPDMLKKLPSRWRKNAKVLACIGLTGTLSLSGCFPFFLGDSTCSNCGFPHLGGSGGSPIYVVYLTEQEARTVMREKWESMGFDFNSTPPDYTVNISEEQDIGIDYYNEEKKAGLSLVSMYESGKHWCYGDNVYTAQMAAKEFEELYKDVDVGVLYNPKKNIGMSEPNAKQKQAAQEALKAQLESQVREFIELFQAQ